MGSKQNEPVADVQYKAIGTVSGGGTKYRVYLAHVANSGQRGVAARAKRGHQASAAPPATSP